MNIIVVIITAIATLTSIGGGIAARDIILERNVLGIVRITRAGWGFIIVSFALIVLPVTLFVFQSASDRAERDARDSVVRRDYKLSVAKEDSEYRASVDSLAKRFGDSNYRTLTIIGKILHDQKDSLDIDNNRIVKLIRDSARTTVAADEPIVELNKIPGYPGLLFLRSENLQNVYQISFVSHDAASCCFDWKISAVISDVNERFVYKGQIPCYFTQLSTIPKNEESHFSFNVDNSIPYEWLYLWIRGTYKNRAGSKTYSYDKVLYNHNPPNSCGEFGTNTRNLVISIVKQNER